jgi:LPS O-antigen subunit length determinant protein (WzzB/FepE family)
MKKVFVLLFLMLGFVSVKSMAQDEVEEVTDEEIMKFAAMEEAVAFYLQEKQEQLVEMIKTDETIGGAGRYNEIKAAWGNEDKLAEISITDAEKEAFQKIQDFMNSLGEDVKNYKVEMIMDADVLGAATYNKVTKAMSADPSLKEKVDSQITQLKEKRAADGDDVTE